jgi:hypothetical protein
MFLALEVQELLKQQQQQSQSHPVVVIMDNATRPCVSLTETFQSSDASPPPLAPYRSSHRTTQAAVRRRRRRKVDVATTTPSESHTLSRNTTTGSSMPSRWDACCYSPIKSSGGNVRNHDFNLNDTSSRLQLSSLSDNFPSMLSPPLTCTTSEPLKMPVRRGSIEHGDMEKGVHPVKNNLASTTTAMAPTTITSSMRDYHLQQRRLYELQGVKAEPLTPHDRRRRRCHSYEKCDTEKSNRRRHDTARVLDEALALLNLQGV